MKVHEITESKQHLDEVVQFAPIVAAAWEALVAIAAWTARTAAWQAIKESLKALWVFFRWAWFAWAWYSVPEMVYEVYQAAKKLSKDPSKLGWEDALSVLIFVLFLRFEVKADLKLVREAIENLKTNKYIPDFVINKLKSMGGDAIKAIKASERAMEKVQRLIDKTAKVAVGVGTPAATLALGGDDVKISPEMLELLKEYHEADQESARIEKLREMILLELQNREYNINPSGNPSTKDIDDDEGWKIAP